jgi:hypothetical protein
MSRRRRRRRRGRKTTTILTIHSNTIWNKNKKMLIIKRK